MDYETACREFNVTPTKRQRRRWNRKTGRAYILARHFGAEGNQPSTEDVADFLSKRSLRMMGKVVA